MNIPELFLKLKDTPSGHAYTALRVVDCNNAYLGVNLTGHPCLFIRTDSRSADPPLRTAKVSLRRSQEFSISVDGAAPSRQLFHVLSCESSDRVEVHSFLILIQAFLANHTHQDVSGDHLALFFRSMARLFAVAPARDLDAERQGLWGELFMMRQVRGFGFWAPSWHTEVTRVFDFSAPAMRVEVKTTTGAQRVHHFSHRQVYALPGEEIVIASLLLTEDDTGVSLRDLIEDCRGVLRGTPDYLKLEHAVRHASMEDSGISGPRFDGVRAGRELAWFRSTDAPQFRMPEPAGVSETRYKVDLSTAPLLTYEELEMWLAAWPTASIEASGIQID